jgi:hypothetical protein
MVGFIDEHRARFRGRADLCGPADRHVGVPRAHGASLAIDRLIGEIRPELT